MSRPCRFFNTPAGCNRGNQCTFAHSPTNQASNRARPLSPSTPDDSRPPQNTARPSGTGNPPRNVCRYYWEHGRCNREFDCRYAHTQKADNTTSPPASTLTSATRSAAVLQRVAPFLTEEGLSKMSGSGSDGFFSQDPSSSLSPTEAHNVLKKYLSDYFRFKNTFEVYAFLKPLNSATVSNTNWV